MSISLPRLRFLFLNNSRHKYSYLSPVIPSSLCSQILRIQHSLRASCHACASLTPWLVQLGVCCRTDSCTHILIYKYSCNNRAVKFELSGCLMSMPEWIMELYQATCTYRLLHAKLYVSLMKKQNSF